MTDLDSPIIEAEVVEDEGGLNPDVPPPQAALRRPRSHEQRQLTSKRLHARLKREGTVFALRLVRDVAYRKRLLDDLRAGTLEPSIERMLWAYAYGTPTKSESISIDAPLGDGATQNVTVVKRVIVRK